MKLLRILTASFLVAFAAGGLMPASARAQDQPAPPPPNTDATGADMSGTDMSGADTTGTDTTGTDTSAGDTSNTDASSTDTSNADATNGGAPSLDYFYDALQSYGQWVQVEGYGYCWQPTAAQDPNWQPYTDGYWAYTDAGWTWASYEDFGWITYHYGRWTQVEDLGWVWVPGYQWAPAWVSWRTSQDYSGPDDSTYIGWAPLPPECHFRRDIGISFWVDTTFDIGPRYYNFCRVRDFGSPVLGPVIIDRSRNITIITHTTNITNITTNNNIVYNGGPSYRAISRRTDPAHPIRTLQLVRQTDPGVFRKNGGKGVLAQSRGNQLIMAAPMIAPPKQPFKPAKVAKVFNKPVINKGWAGVNPQQKLQAQAALKAQTKGLKPNQPAKPVTAQQLSVVPKGPLPAKIARPGVVTPAPNPVIPAPTPHGKKPRPTPPLTPVNPAAPAVAPAIVAPGATPAVPAKPLKTPHGKKLRSTPPVAPVNPSVPGAPAAIVPAKPAPANPAMPSLTPRAKKPHPTPPPAPAAPAANGGPPPPNAAAVAQQQQAAAQAAKLQQLQQQHAAALATKQQQLQQQQAAAQAAKQEQLQQQQAAAQAVRQQQLQQQQAAAAAVRQQQLQQQQAAAAAAAAARAKPPVPPVPPKGGKPTPTPAPGH